ncbi:MAG: HAMP domain-containing protein [Thiobacillaceae bacterium]|jgi:PAS domain S-box-containing protein|nr:HAMP domain-containing protein [Thiobacillaceae bacterium]
MRIEALSLRAVTVMIFVMIAVVATVLSLLAGGYFRQAALEAQAASLSRVIEVAAQEMLRSVRGHTFDLGMRLAHSEEVVRALRDARAPGGRERLVGLLDDPFINGFVGFANINLEKIRVYDLDLRPVAESAKGIAGLPGKLADPLTRRLAERSGVERLKAIDALWISPQGPLHSTLVPIGGLRVAGYLEIVINPVFNLPDIGAITRTPISILTPDGRPILVADPKATARHLPIEYILPASDGSPAFKVVGFEDVSRLNARMDHTLAVTVGGFLLLTFGTLLFALWLFNRFLFAPVRRMARDMERMAAGKLNGAVDRTGLREFSLLATSFNTMAEQVRRRTGDLERLLDLDDSAILCFDDDQEAIYFNRGAVTLFGYNADEIADLDLGDLCAEDVVGLLREACRRDAPSCSITHALTCIRRDGSRFERPALIRSLGAQGGRGYAIMLYAAPRADELLSAETMVSGLQRNEQRMNAVEQSLNTLLELARGAPVVMSPAAGTGPTGSEGEASAPERPAIREQAVNVMLCALACWEHDLDKSKLDLAEESRIWPVYIDKSTPTTRTLDKYLNLDTCPRNPRTQRVIDTAEFVLKQLGRRSSPARKKLQQALNDFRLLVSGIRPAGD